MHFAYFCVRASEFGWVRVDTHTFLFLFFFWDFGWEKHVDTQLSVKKRPPRTRPPSIPPPACVPRWRRIWSPAATALASHALVSRRGSATEEMLGVSFTTAASQRMTTAPVPRHSLYCVHSLAPRDASLAARCSRARVVRGDNTFLCAMLLHPCQTRGYDGLVDVTTVEGTSLRHALSTLLESHTGLGGRLAQRVVTWADGTEHSEQLFDTPA